jgi:hypothetical protein
MFHPPQGTLASQRYQASASNNIIASMDTERTYVNTSSYALLKQVKLNAFGVIRTYFELAVYGNDVAYGKVYRNGVPVGTERSTSSTSYVAFTEDIPGWMDGDFCQLYTYHWGGYSGTYGKARNFRVMGDIQVIVSPTIARVDID